MSVTERSSKPLASEVQKSIKILIGDALRLIDRGLEDEKDYTKYTDRSRVSVEIAFMMGTVHCALCSRDTVQRDEDELLKTGNYIARSFIDTYRLVSKENIRCECRLSFRTLYIFVASYVSLIIREIQHGLMDISASDEKLIGKNLSQLNVFVQEARKRLGELDPHSIPMNDITVCQR